MAGAVRVKICGITSAVDAAAAVAAGADALGLVFWEPSPRSITPAQARDIAASVGPFTALVGLFVDPEKALVERVLAAVPLHLLQFHGDEPRAYCEQFQRPYLKALRMRADLEVEAAMAGYDSATGILLDAYRPGVPGGTGATFDWARVPRGNSERLILAGGLTAANVGEAVERTRPYAVDVSGGVELAPGRKDPQKVAAFITAAKGAGTAE
ncbi:phosphoribosylanthranilate isomerase [Exilibacterium tricleocarpae]|uniref:N-(5'-phosphoribosyl)anthranilate isomerase n=1 Tax=Exilibacterium tricleocarpae TaxID=2591008 RepID=A0A545SRU2_9GAMM|nr:phosphoribosylanthranilate isomerase [Exilibacterium tricleocarpae]TQV67693.1 phosphoribosylanthranilate isomerase [Exilibacterium tricleocarpae]